MENLKIKTLARARILIMKLFISPDQLRTLSFSLASQIDRAPDFLVPLWRGGTPIGCYVHEFLKRKFPEKAIDHIPIRTSRYQGQEGKKEAVFCWLTTFGMLEQP